ncbi:hotdog fold thioesterase [Nocardia sp. NBC_01009]|uniref:PaaI family thioesterase n=1 Tax=Nocardia sp. NBC_01009 TaxID=2975996 RepID=UPI003863B8DE|nr:hotdog fold thioesterase [Nocardia sp. NBC_01009]
MTDAPVGLHRATPNITDGDAAVQLTALLQGRLPGLLGVRVLTADAARVTAEMEVREELMAPNGYLHAATVVALADTACGLGTRLSLPDRADRFTTIELKSNFLATARAGLIRTEATLVHGGRRTQVWDAVVSDGAGKTMALFRCTQLIL